MLEPTAAEIREAILLSNPELCNKIDTLTKDLNLHMAVAGGRGLKVELTVNELQTPADLHNYPIIRADLYAKVKPT